MYYESVATIVFRENELWKSRKELLIRCSIRENISICFYFNFFKRKARPPPSKTKNMQKIIIKKLNKGIIKRREWESRYCTGTPDN